MSKDLIPELEPIKVEIFLMSYKQFQKPASRSNSQTLKDTSFTYKHKSPIQKIDSIGNEFNDVSRVQSLKGLINPRSV